MVYFRQIAVYFCSIGGGEKLPQDLATLLMSQTKHVL
jgi:hypothetical protein